MIHVTAVRDYINCSSWTFYDCDEYSFRIWQPKAMPGYLNVSSVVNTVHFPGECLGFSYENRPPDSLLKNAIAPPNATDSISVNVDFRNNNRLTLCSSSSIINLTSPIIQIIPESLRFSLMAH